MFLVSIILKYLKMHYNIPCLKILSTHFYMIIHIVSKCCDFFNLCRNFKSTDVVKANLKKNKWFKNRIIHVTLTTYPIAMRLYPHLGYLQHSQMHQLVNLTADMLVTEVPASVVVKHRIYFYSVKVFVSLSLQIYEIDHLQRYIKRNLLRFML